MPDFRGNASLQRKIRMRQRWLPLAVHGAIIGLTALSDHAFGQTRAFQPTYEEDTTRRGQDYRSFHPVAPSALYCQQACITESQCRAWSYDSPSVSGGKQPMCWLKASVPPLERAQGIVSGVVRLDALEAAAKPQREKLNAPAQGGSIKAIFEKYDLLGTFAFDCSRPVSKDNLYFITRAIDDKHVQRDQMSGPTTRDYVTIFDKAVELPADEISVSGDRSGVRSETVYRLEKNRTHAIEATLGGDTLIADGKFIGNGQEVPWANKCGPSRAQEGSVEAIFENYNLLGTFAFDCSKPASNTNFYYVHRVMDTGHVERARVSGPAGRDYANIIDKASGLGPNEVSVSGTRVEGNHKNEPIEEVWRVEPNRAVTMEGTLGGAKMISGRRFNGQEVPWIYKCSAPGTLSSESSVSPPSGTGNAPGSSPATPAAANPQNGSVKAIFEKYNLIGIFAQDCSRPAKAVENWYYVDRLIDPEHVQRDLMESETTRTQTLIIDQAWELRANEVVVVGTRDNQPTSGIWRLDKDRMVQWDTIHAGQKLITAGKWVKTGADMPWINRCGDLH